MQKSRNNLKKRTPDTSIISVMQALAEAPEQIHAAATRLAAAQADHEKYLAGLSLDALSAPIFPGKTPADPCRPAANDAERKVALDHLLHVQEVDYTPVRGEFDSARIDLALCKDRLDAYTLIARLIIHAHPV